MVSGGGVNWSMVSTVVFSSKVGETFALWVVALYFLTGNYFYNCDYTHKMLSKNC